MRHCGDNDSLQQCSLVRIERCPFLPCRATPHQEERGLHHVLYHARTPVYFGVGSARREPAPNGRQLDGPTLMKLTAAAPKQGTDCRTGNATGPRLHCASGSARMGRGRMRRDAGTGAIRIISRSACVCVRKKKKINGCAVWTALAHGTCCQHPAFAIYYCDIGYGTLTDC